MSTEAALALSVASVALLVAGCWMAARRSGGDGWKVEMIDQEQTRGAKEEARIEATRAIFDCRPWEQPTWVEHEDIAGLEGQYDAEIALAVLVQADLEWQTREATSGE